MESEKRKVVLYIITKSNMGGAQRYVYDLATHLPADKFEPVVAFGGNGILKEKLELTDVKTVNIPGLERDVKFFKEIIAFFAILKIIWKLKPAIVHLNSSKAGFLGSFAARLCNFFIRLSNLLNPKRYTLTPSRIIFTAHGWAFKEKRKTATKKIIEYASWLTIFLCHKTIVVSQDDLEKVKNFLFVQSKITLIHNGIGKLDFLEKANARKILTEKIRRDISGKDFWVGTIAELHKNKGLEHAISAINSIPQNTEPTGERGNTRGLAYVIIGEGEERPNLEKVIEQNNLANTVFLTGEYPGASKLLKAFDIFLLPSLKEGLPYTILEAGLAGLPIIATNVGGIPEIIADMKSGIVIRAKRTKEISEALTFLLNHEEKMKEFGEQLKKTVEENYTLERMIKDTVLLYG
jgi:glycosyltransferase involved in cell wall biosynthesis